MKDKILRGAHAYCYYDGDIKAYRLDFKHQLLPSIVEQAYNWLITELQSKPLDGVSAVILDFTDVHHFHMHATRAFQKKNRHLDTSINSSALPTLLLVQSAYQEQMAIMFGHIGHLDGRAAVCKSKADIMHFILFFRKRLAVA